LNSLTKITEADKQNKNSGWRTLVLSEIIPVEPDLGNAGVGRIAMTY
jgi:hypothetical protein